MAKRWQRIIYLSSVVGGKLTAKLPLNGAGVDPAIG